MPKLNTSRSTEETPAKIYAKQLPPARVGRNFRAPYTGAWVGCGECSYGTEASAPSYDVPPAPEATREVLTPRGYRQLCAAHAVKAVLA